MVAPTRFGANIAPKLPIAISEILTAGFIARLRMTIKLRGFYSASMRSSPFLTVTAAWEMERL